MSYLKRIFNKEYNVEITPNEEINHLEYSNSSIYSEIEKMIKKYPNNDALCYYGKNISYESFGKLIDKCAKSLKKIGIDKGERVTICMPNTPEAIIMFYAVNLIGAVSSMIHPLSSVNEIEYYLDIANSKYILTVDLFEEKVIEAARKVNAKKIIIAPVTQSMYKPVKTVLSIYSNVTSILKREEKKTFTGEDIISWNEFLELGKSYKKEFKYYAMPNDEAVVLYSGGTTGKPKGVRLSNLNFNALSLQCATKTGAKSGQSVLVILPIFHGFGLAVSVHTPLMNGLKIVLVPKFVPNDFAKLIKRHKPVFLTGVPTMYEALINNEDKTDYLKCVENAICGGDLLQPSLRERVNKYFQEHGSSAQIRQGYGLTESTAACVLTPKFFYKEGCVGKTLQDNIIKVVKEGTTKELKYNRVGEICVSGPTVMLGYLNEEEETKKALQVHEDGRVYLHTGDLGYIDKNGYLYFKSRLKRMIVTSGYNIYPAVLEKIIIEHPAVLNVVVVGIPHPYKKQVPIACIVLKDNYEESNELTEDIKLFCTKSIAKYALPYRYHYIKSIPKTLIGKVNFKKLEEECTRKYGKK